MKKINFSLISFLFLLSSTAYSFDGPLQVKNQFPLFFHIYTPYLEKAVVEDSLSFNISHSSIYLVDNASEWDIGLDMEMTELNFIFRKKIKDIIELSIHLPFISFNSGFMDSFINSYHDAFDFPDYGRSNRPQNEFLYKIKRKGVLIIKGKSGRIGIGDIRFSVKKPLLKIDPVVSIKWGVELPTGNSEEGYGSGSIDTAVGLLVDKRWGELFKTYLNMGIVFPGNLKGQSTVELKEFFTGGLAIEAAFWENTNLIGQIFIQESPFPKTGISSVDRTALLLSLGGRYQSNNNSFEISFTEDPNTSGAPDFTLSFNFKRRF